MKTQDLYQNLIVNYKSSIERTRRVFVTLNVITIIYLIGYFNYRWTWMRHLSEGHVNEYIITTNSNTISRPPNYLELADPGNPDQIIDVRRKLIEENIGDKFRFINIDLIGSRIFIDDLPIIGGITIIVMLTWFYYVIRREKGIANEIYRITKKETDSNSIVFLFYGTAFNEIFNSIYRIDYDGNSDLNEVGNKVLKGIRRLMLFAPTIILTLIILHDLKETFFTKKFNSGVTTLWQYLVSHKQGDQLAEIIIRLIFSFAFIILAYIITFGILRINRKLSFYMDRIEEKYHEINKPA